MGCKGKRETKLANIRINQLRLNLDEEIECLQQKAAKMMSAPQQDLQAFRLVKMSLDARKKQDIHHMCSVEFTLPDSLAGKVNSCRQVQVLEPIKTEKIDFGKRKLNNRPVVVGSGPCGLFAAWLLAENGYAPIILERGKKVEERIHDVERLFESGELNLQSNVAFGEGGAGTFSDGKLTWRGKDIRGRRVLAIFADCGAPDDIIYQAKAHIGSDRLRNVLIQMRKKIEAMGGTFCFEHCVKRWRFQEGQLTGLSVEGETNQIDTDVCILATGHSARDTFETLHAMQVGMEAKPFAVGFRVEHVQERINEAQFGKWAGHPRLGSAEYALTEQFDKRGVYSFCMCPGGQVVCGASEEHALACNGMSFYARNQKNANAALIVQVSPNDFGTHPLDGLAFQRHWEKYAYRLGGGHYYAPIQTLSDFLQGRKTEKLGEVTPSYLPGTEKADLSEALPGFCIQALRQAFPAFGRKMKGFDAADALLTGTETRTSSPLRIIRNERGESISHAGIYPAGEGAGYAGGIVSAAVDGLRVAQHIMEEFSPLEK